MKKILLIGLVLVLLLTVLMPSAALARDDRNTVTAKAAKDFSGQGVVYVTSMPAPVIHGDIWRYYDEIAEGILTESSWDLLVNTAFWSSHDSVVKVGSDGSARGWMTGTFTLTSLIYPDSVLQGVFQGKISGNLALDPASGIFPYICDAGTWYSTGGTGVFAGIKAWGNWSASLNFDPSLGTLIGPLEWQGKYLATSAIKPPRGRPFNLNEYLKSCRIIQPWTSSFRPSYR